MKMKKTILLSLLATILVSCYDDTQSSQSSQPDTYKITTFEGIPLLGEVYYPEYDADRARDAILGLHQFMDEIIKEWGLCSAFRHGQYQVRNLDWFIQDQANLIIHLPANPATGRLASVSGALVNGGMVKQATLDAGVLSDKVELLPGVVIDDVINTLPVIVTDGINEAGVCINVNVVTKEVDRDGYKAITADKTRPIWSIVSVCRFVLDNCHSVDEAIQKLDTLNVEEVPLIPYDFHFMISDQQKTIVAEWYDGKFVHTDFVNNGTDNTYLSDGVVPAVMTNSYVCKMKELIVSPQYNTQYHSADGGLTPAGYDELYIKTPKAVGVERYYRLVDGQEGTTSPLSMISADLSSVQKQIETVFYSKTYMNDWKCYSEYSVYIWKNEDNTWSSMLEPLTDFPGAYDALVSTYNNPVNDSLRLNYKSLEYNVKELAKGNESTNWYTCATCVFDIQEKAFYLMPQEGYYSSRRLAGKYIKFKL